MSAELVGSAHKIVHISPRVVLDDAIPIDCLIPRRTKAAESGEPPLFVHAHDTLVKRNEREIDA